LLVELREAGVPVIVVTGSAEVDAADWAKDAAAVLGKPFALDDLLRAVHAAAKG
jgi:FixJ family two-component response regulator